MCRTVRRDQAALKAATQSSLQHVLGSHRRQPDSYRCKHGASTPRCGASIGGSTLPADAYRRKGSALGAAHHDQCSLQRLPGSRCLALALWWLQLDAAVQRAQRIAYVQSPPAAWIRFSRVNFRVQAWGSGTCNPCPARCTCSLNAGPLCSTAHPLGAIGSHKMNMN